MCEAHKCICSNNDQQGLKKINEYYELKSKIGEEKNDSIIDGQIDLHMDKNLILIFGQVTIKYIKTNRQWLVS